MIKPVDIKAKIAEAPFLDGRSNETTEADANAAFPMLAKFRNGGIFVGSFAGDSHRVRARGFALQTRVQEFHGDLQTG